MGGDDWLTVCSSYYWCCEAQTHGLLLLLLHDGGLTDSRVLVYGLDKRLDQWVDGALGCWWRC